MPRKHALEHTRRMHQKKALEKHENHVFFMGVPSENQERMEPEVVLGHSWAHYQQLVQI